MNSSVNQQPSAETTPAEDLIPHSGSMVLIDEVLRCDSESLTAVVTPDPSVAFADHLGNVPAWIGIEYMAQSIAAWSGNLCREAGAEISVGFLIGVRRYQATITEFVAHQRLTIQVVRNYQEGGMASFDCKIFDTNQSELASALVSVYQPQPGDDNHE